MHVPRPCTRDLKCLELNSRGLAGDCDGESTALVHRQMISVAFGDHDVGLALYKFRCLVNNVEQLTSLKLRGDRPIDKSGYKGQKKASGL